MNPERAQNRQARRQRPGGLCALGILLALLALAGCAGMGPQGKNPAEVVTANKAVLIPGKKLRWFIEGQVAFDHFEVGAQYLETIEPWQMVEIWKQTDLGEIYQKKIKKGALRNFECYQISADFVSTTHRMRLRDNKYQWAIGLMFLAINKKVNHVMVCFLDSKLQLYGFEPQTGRMGIFKRGAKFRLLVF